MTTLLSGTEYLNMRLNGVVVNGKKFQDLDKTKQAEIRSRALMAAEPMLQSLQAGGQKASKDDVKTVVDSLFANRVVRDTFMGMTYGERRQDGVLIDEAGAPARAKRLAVEKALRDAGYEPTPELVTKYLNAAPQ